MQNFNIIKDNENRDLQITRWNTLNYENEKILIMEIEGETESYGSIYRDFRLEDSFIELNTEINYMNNKMTFKVGKDEDHKNVFSARLRAILANNFGLDNTELNKNVQ